MALSFAADIRPLFREEDLECIKPMEVDLYEYAWICVRANAQSVYGTLADGSMSPDAPWPQDKNSLFKSWMDAGYPA
ncbi:MAG TPA: hypothetical protein VNU92_07240 [Edaphobacter sp.]|jgi:hypothetical protein|nr:hypothetical protein [Edaphobacter sp.]